MKIRLEGTFNEINDFIPDLTNRLELKIKSVSKFYPNREQNINCLEKIGRVYIEVES